MRKAVIFDMDGVLVVNMHFHEQAFYEFGRRHGIEITREFFLTHIAGNTNERIMPKLFGELSIEDNRSFSSEKEAIYRELYSPHIKCAEGLIEFLDFLKSFHIPMAIASNAPEENILFLAEALGLEKYFSTMLHVASVLNPKPAPDMFLKAAQLLGAEPKSSVVFEDAPGGIRAANDAGMKAIGVLTTHEKEEFDKVDLFIHTFQEATLYDFFRKNILT